MIVTTSSISIPLAAAAIVTAPMTNESITALSAPPTACEVVSICGVQIDWASTAKWSELHRQTSAWLNLPNDWDGDEGIAPTRDVIEAGRAFLRAAQAIGIPAPRSYVMGDGEIGYRWEKDGLFASVSFLSDGSIVALAESADKPPLRIDQPYNGVSKVELFDRLKRLA